MKWLGKVLHSLFLLCVGTLLVALLQPWANSLADDEALRAKVEFGKWVERPTKDGVVDEKMDADPEYADILKQVFADNDEFESAFILLENPSSKIATDIRIRFADPNDKDVMFFTDDGRLTTSMIGVNDIKLPDMRPGDMIKIYIWDDSGFRETLFPEAFKTYSSLGSFQTQLSLPKRSDYYESDSYLNEVGDSVFWFFFLIMGAFFVILLIIGAVSQDSYIKKILGNREEYEKESERYKQDPKKFTPKF